MQFTRKHINILQGTLHTRAYLGRLRLRWSEIWTTIPEGAFYHYQLKVIARNDPRKQLTGCSPDFAATRQSPVGEIAPVFVCQRVVFHRKSFPPAWDSHGCGPAGGNIHWQTSTV